MSRRALAIVALTLGSVALAAPSAEDDNTPLQMYLEAPEILARLTPQLAPLEECFGLSSAAGRISVGEVYLNWTIAPDGEVRDAHVEASKSGLPDLDECLADRAGDLVFRSHDEEPIEVGYPLVWRDAQLQSYPMVFVKERPVDLLFLYVPAGASAAARALIGQAPVDVDSAGGSR